MDAPETEWDAENRTLWIQVSDRVIWAQRPIGRNVLVDVDEDGNAVAVEVYWARDEPPSP